MKDLPAFLRIPGLLALALAVTCCGGASSNQSGQRSEKKVGGCEVDTVSLGLYLKREAAVRVPDRISVRSTRDIGHEKMREAALELTEALDSLGVKVVGRSELLHILEGPCWPEFSISIEVDLVSRDNSERIRDALAAARIAGLLPSLDRGEDYGDFFVTAGRGSSDWWTLWYRK
ncbi:MAG TPA: hypothetical protein VLA34_06285 [Candidatus Krumholzibacterium sp.]|nr:hypothetical protein [Candidatus Krumholzibacterium sp.]